MDATPKLDKIMHDHRVVRITLRARRNEGLELRDRKVSWKSSSCESQSGPVRRFTPGDRLRVHFVGCAGVHAGYFKGHGGWWIAAYPISRSRWRSVRLLLKDDPH